MFRSMQISGWRQFGRVDVSFHDRLTVLTGANGAGKTTMLNMLNRHFGWDLSLVSTPRRGKELVEFWSDYWRGETPERADEGPDSDYDQIGSVTYTDGTVASLRVPRSVTEEYKVMIRNQQTTPGLFVSSHRPAYFYQKLTSIPAEPSARSVLINTYMNELRSRYSINYRVQSPSMRLKEALISLAVFGPGNSSVSPNPDYQRAYDGFQDVLRVVLPQSLKFHRLHIDAPNVTLKTGTGDFSLDSVSGGVSSIIDLAWQVFMYSTEQDEFSVVIDEPENHLHPQLQQELMPALLRAFPQAQFIIATHNPFMVTSVEDSHVYVLRYDGQSRVYSELLDTVNKAGTANEILRDVLGLNFTTPLWASSELDRVLSEYIALPVSEVGLSSLRTELARLGLSDSLPSAIARWVDEAPDD